MDFVYGLGGDEQAGDVGEEEVGGEEEEECAVVAGVGGDVVVDEEEEEDDDDAHDCGEECVEEFFDAGFAQDVAVGALEGVECEPSEGYDDESEPEVGVVEDGADVGEGGR